MTKRLLFLLFSLFSWSLFSSALPEKLPLSDIEGGGICMVDGVNVITGSYSYNVEPFATCAPEPVSYQMGYSTGLRWQNNLDVSLYFAAGICRYFQFGTGAHFFQYSNSCDSNFRIKVDRDENKGITNLGQGLPSRKTNLCNLNVKIPNKVFGDSLTMTAGDGSQKIFSKDYILKYSGSILSANYTLSRVLTPRGNKVGYTYRNLPGGSYPIVRGIQNFSGKNIFGSIEVTGRYQNTTKHSVVESNDGRKLTISWGKIGKEYLPVTVLHPHRPDYHFEYINHYFAHPYLFKIDEGKGRQIEIGYHGQERPQNDYERNHPRNFFGRVETIVKTQGPGLGRHNLYWFQYSFDSQKSDSGKTLVTDALGSTRIFTYDDQLHIKEIEYTAYQSRLKAERFSWGGGRLLGKTVLDGNLKKVFSTQFTYDRRGNITLEKNLGSFTGSSDDFDARVIISCYSDDGFNNLIERNDGDTITKYKYRKGTSLCTHEYTTDSDNILRRTFRDYDQNGTLLEEIVDDGSDEDIKSLADVTRRLITRYTPKKEAPCIGLPVEVVQLYSDPFGNEKQLKRIENRYSPEGWLIEQKVYDADDSYCYTLQWEYNRFGKVTKEIDPLGNETVRSYNSFGNMTVEESPLHKITYEYDYQDRPLTKTMKVDQDLSLSEHYTYHPMGPMTSSTDIFGHTTTYKIDSYGRTFQKTLPDGAEYRYSYDCFGNTTGALDPMRKSTKTTYNCLKQPLTITHADGTQEKNIYYVNGLLKSHTGQTGVRTEYSYDCLKRPLGQKVFSKESLLSESKKVYHRDSLIYEVDTAGVITSYTYDGAGRKTSASTCDRRTTYEYDSLGRLHIVKKWRSESQFTSAIKEYDFLDRVIEERVEDETGKIYSKKLVEYDALGRRTKVINYIDGQPAITQFAYNCIGDVIQTIDPEGNETTVHYNYSFSGERVLQKSTTDPKGIITVETYDIRQRMVSTHFPAIFFKNHKFHRRTLPVSE